MALERQSYTYGAIVAAADQHVYSSFADVKGIDDRFVTLVSPDSLPRLRVPAANCCVGGGGVDA